jgi:uracil-DNA glycosylase family 4
VTYLSKVELIMKIADEISGCVKCPLWRGRKKAVPGEGKIDAKVFFLGEAPGYWEDVKGLPFVGAAGKVLDWLLESIDLSRDSVFITNIVKCRPPENRAPRSVEVETCTSLYLNRQVDLIKPEVLATLGRHSTAYILSKVGVEKVANITECRGKVYKVRFLGLPLVVMPMYHPASVLHNPKYRGGLESDFRLLKKELRKRRIIS